MRDDEHAAHHVAEQPHQQRKRARDGLDHVERQHQPRRFGEAARASRRTPRARMPNTAIATNTIERQRRVGFQMRGRRLDAGDQRRPVRGKNEQEQRADQRQIRPRVGAHGVADLPGGGVDQHFQHRLRGGGVQRQAARQQPGTTGQHRHDAPGDQHRRGDRHRAEMEHRRHGQRGFGHGDDRQHAQHQQPREHHAECGEQQRPCAMPCGEGQQQGHARPAAAPARRAPAPRCRRRCKAACSTAAARNARCRRKPDRPAARISTRSWPVHPTPRAPAAERQAGHQQRAGPEDAGAEPAIDPAAGEHAEQCRQHDRSSPARRPARGSAPNEGSPSRCAFACRVTRRRMAESKWFCSEGGDEVMGVGESFSPSP